MSRDPGSNQCIETEALLFGCLMNRKVSQITTGRDQIDTRHFLFFLYQIVNCID
jgi:hypothetical protein